MRPIRHPLSAPFACNASTCRLANSVTAWIILDGAKMLAEARFKKVGYAALSGMRALRDGLAFGIDATNPRVEYWGKHELGLAPQDFELTRLFDDVVLDGS